MPPKFCFRDSGVLHHYYVLTSLSLSFFIKALQIFKYKKKYVEGNNNPTTEEAYSCLCTLSTHSISCVIFSFDITLVTFLHVIDILKNMAFNSSEYFSWLGLSFSSQQPVVGHVCSFSHSGLALFFEHLHSVITFTELIDRGWNFASLSSWQPEILDYLFYGYETFCGHFKT